MVGSTAVVTETYGYQVARSLTDGRVLWKRDTNHTFCHTHRKVAMLRDVLVQAFTCKSEGSPDTGWVMGTDPATGRTRWQHRTHADTIAHAQLSVAPDGSAVAVTLIVWAEADKAGTAGRGSTVVPDSSVLWLLDPASGAVLYGADPRKARGIRALGDGWWLTTPWPSTPAATTASTGYALGSVSGQGRAVSITEGECLAARALVLDGGWICQPVSDSKPPGYLAVPADRTTTAQLSTMNGPSWLTDVPGALIAWGEWADSGPTWRITGLRWP
jgi:hypothetical protein